MSPVESILICLGFLFVATVIFLMRTDQFELQRKITNIESSSLQKEILLEDDITDVRKLVAGLSHDLNKLEREVYEHTHKDPGELQR